MPILMDNLSHSLFCRDQKLDLSQACIMGILNVTPDSFSDGGKFMLLDNALQHTQKMLDEGAHIIDIGGYSSRPGAEHISEQMELDRVYPVAEALLQNFPDIIISIDSFRAEVARQMLELGVHIINDISGGELDVDMMTVVGKYNAAYIAMHMPGRPQNMQSLAKYDNVVMEVKDFLLSKKKEATAAGIKSLILDPGFGFGKTQAHNYRMLNGFDEFVTLGSPLMAGISRKSMLYRFFETSPDRVLNEASALHLKLLEQGASILRVHDVQAASRIGQLFVYMRDL